MPDPSSRPTPPTAAIATYREALLRHAPADELARLAEPLDPEIVAWLDLFQASRQEAIRPDPAFVRRLDRIIAAAPGPQPARSTWASPTPLRLIRSHAANGRRQQMTAQPTNPIRPLPWQTSWLQSAARLAAAVLLIALLVGSAWTALYPLQLWDREGLPLFAPESTQVVAPPSGDGVLLDLNLTDIPPYLTEQGIAQTTYPPGGRSREFVNMTAEVMFIAGGPMTVHAEEAPEPIRIIPPVSPDADMAPTLLEAGETTTLQTGTALVALPGSVVALSNEGDDATVMLDLLWATASGSTESGGAQWTKGWGGRPLDLLLPVSIVLRQLTLPAGESLSVPDSESVSQAAVTVDPGREADLHPVADGSLRNGGDAPLDLYAVTITTNVENVAPPASADILQFLWESEGGPEGLSRPYGLGVDPSGNLWVSDAGNDRFQILAPNGSLIDTWGTPGNGEGEFEFFSPRSMYGAPYGDVAFDADGNIYVVDTGNFRVQKFAPDRTFLLAWGSEGEEDGQFLAASSIAIGPDGLVYVGDESRGDIQTFAPDGRFLRVIGGPNADEGGLGVPGGIAVAPDGDIWVADYRNNHIVRFNPDGELRSSWGTLGAKDGQLVSPNDVAVDESGHVFVADDGNNRLQVFTEDGEFLATVGGFAPDALVQFRDAVAVAIADDGAVYISDDPVIQAFRFTTPDVE